MIVYEMLTIMSCLFFSLYTFKPNDKVLIYFPLVQEWRFQLQGFLGERRGEREDMQDSHMILDDFTPQFSTPLPSNMLVQLLIFGSSQPFTFPDYWRGSHVVLVHFRGLDYRGSQYISGG